MRRPLLQGPAEVLVLKAKSLHIGRCLAPIEDYARTSMAKRRKTMPVAVAGETGKGTETKR